MRLRGHCDGDVLGDGSIAISRHGPAPNGIVSGAESVVSERAGSGLFASETALAQLLGLEG